MLLSIETFLHPIPSRYLMNSSSNNQNEQEKKAKPKLVYFMIFFATLALGGIALLTSLYFLNNFREPIATGLSRATGLKITFESIGLNFAHGLGLRCGGVTVHTANGKRSLFSAEKIIVEVEALPLLHKQIIVKSSTLVNPVFQIHFDASAKPAAPAPATEQTTGTPSPASSDKSTVKQTPTEKARNILRNMDLTLSDITIENGKILLLRESALLEIPPLNFSLKFKILRPNHDRIDLSITPIVLGMGPFKLKGDISIDALMSPGATLQANVKLDSFTDSDLYQTREFLPDFAQQILEQKVVSGKFQNISFKTQFPIEPVNNIESIKHLANAHMTFNIDDATLSQGKQTIPFPHTEFDLKWENDRLTHIISGSALDGKFQLNGTLLPESDSPIDTDITLTNISLNKTKLSGDWAPSGGTVSGKLHLNIPKDKGLVWQGQLDANNITLGIQDKNRSVQNASIKIQTQSEKQTRFDVKLNGIVLGQTKLKQAVGAIAATKDTLQLSGGRVYPEHGQIDLSGNYYPASQTYNTRFAGNKLVSEDLLPEYLEGPLDLDGNLTQGKNAKHPLRGLSGSMQIKCSDGSLRQLGFLTALLTLLNPQSVVTAQKQGLNYSYLGGNFKIDGGIVTTADLALKGPQLNLLAAGRTDLVTDNLKGEIKAMPLQLVDTVVKIIPLLGKILANKGGVVETYFEVDGTLANPKFKFLPAKSIIGKPVRALEEIIKLPGSLVAEGSAETKEPAN